MKAKLSSFAWGLIFVDENYLKKFDKWCSADKIKYIFISSKQLASLYNSRWNCGKQKSELWQIDFSFGRGPQTPLEWNERHLYSIQDISWDVAPKTALFSRKDDPLTLSQLDAREAQKRFSIPLFQKLFYVKFTAYR